MSRIGEIIETSTVGFWAESAELHQLPALGELVTVALPDDLTLVGVVAFGQTTGIDEGRRAVRRGDATIYDDAIYDHHPELRRILRTTFQVVTVGYSDAQQRPRHHLPPVPPPLHYSVSLCDQQFLRRFTEIPHYFAILEASTGTVSPEQLLAAHIRAVTVARGNDEDWRIAAGRQVARLLKRDYDRLLTVLEAIDPGPQATLTRPTSGSQNGHPPRVPLRLVQADDDLPF